MSFQETDISWQVLRRIARQWTGHAAEIEEVKPLVGGCINTTLAITLSDGNKAVLKISPHRVNRDLNREAHQLRLLRSMDLPVPTVYLSHMGDLECPHSYILMEFLDGIDMGHAKQQMDAAAYDELQKRLAELVVTIHSHTGEKYMRHTPDESASFDNWPAFYRYVYDPIWADVQQSELLPPKLKKQIAKIHERLDKLLAHDDLPRLVHWDIWAANILVKLDDAGQWKISGLLDPNCKFAHAEAEIAYMEQFHTITPAFLKVYQQTRKLPPEYQRVRKWVYQMYPMLNHVHLFGKQYVKPLTAAVEKVFPLI